MKIENISKNAFIIVASMLLVCFSWGLRIAWFGFHLLTVLVMYGRHGIVGAIVGFILPIISEIYAMAMVLYYQGFKNFYIVSFLVLLFITALPYTLIAVANMLITLFANKEKK